MRVRQEGFSLAELTVVIVVILIIAAMALPLISRALRIYRVKVGAESLATQLNRARTEAVRRGRSITVFIEPTNSKIFTDFNRNGIKEGIDDAGVLAGLTLNEEFSMPSGVTLELFGQTSDAMTTCAPIDRLIFDSRGGLQLTGYRDTPPVSTCIDKNLTPPAPNRSLGAILMRCRDDNATVRYVIGVSLRGGISVIPN